MSILKLNNTMSLDGFVAGPRQSVENSLGEGGEPLHDWAFLTRTFRAVHGPEIGKAVMLVVETREKVLPTRSNEENTRLVSAAEIVSRRKNASLPLHGKPQGWQTQTGFCAQCGSRLTGAESDQPSQVVG